MLAGLVLKIYTVKKEEKGVKKIIILLVVLIFAAGVGGGYLGYQKGAKQQPDNQAGGRTEYQTGYKVGYDSGYNDGLVKGYEAGKEDGYLVGYQASQIGEKKQEKEPYVLNLSETLDTSNFIQSGLIQMWAIHFFNLVITDISISDYTVVLASVDGNIMGWERLMVVAGPATEINKAVQVPVGDGRVTFKEVGIKFADLRVGDVVEVYALWQEHNDMQPEGRITVWDKRDLGKIVESEKLALSIPWTAGISGEVEQINGRTLTLVRGGERLDVFAREDALVYLLIYQGSRNKVDFGEIKVGDSIAFDANFTKDKKLEGAEITIFPRH